MDEQTKTNLGNEGIWIRLIYMVLLGLAYGVAEAIWVVVVLFQWLAALVTGQVNQLLHEFGANLSRYIYEIVRFQTFNSEQKPFPFSDWPDQATGVTPWSGGQADEAPKPPSMSEPDGNGAERDPQAPNPSASQPGEIDENKS